MRIKQDLNVILQKAEDQLSERPSLSRGDVHVWCGSLASPPEAEANEMCAGEIKILSPAEIAQAARFSRPLLRHRYLQIRIWVRQRLADYISMPAGELAFARADSGKPYLLNTPINFNLSHCADRLVLAIANHWMPGIDLEQVSERHQCRSIAERYFHPIEVAGLQALPPEEQMQGFYRYWTLKEAFFKALGTGLSTGMDKVIFTFQNETVCYHFSDNLKEDPQDWQFRQWRWGDSYLALAVKGDAGAPLNVTFLTDTDTDQPLIDVEPLITQSQPTLP